jgi:hypothetical protein
MARLIQHCLVALSLGLWAIATPAAATTITYNWRGVVDHVDHVVPGFGVRPTQRINIHLTLDDAVPDTNPASDIGEYDTVIFPPILVVAVDIGGFTGIGSFQSATVFNDHNGTDAFSVSTGDLHIGNVSSFDFSTSDLGVLTSDALPLSLNPAKFDTATFQVYGYYPGVSGRILGSLPGVVPLPGSAVMLVSALAGLVGAGWYKSRRLGTAAL